MSISLSAYRIMWIQVIFDLPVQTKKERKEAVVFRNFLLDNAFVMVQYSVYQRFCVNKVEVESLIKTTKLYLPEKGKVHILTFTDRQYQNIVSFIGKKDENRSDGVKQYELF